ncbi:uncharacterized protein LOC113235352 [Hyposmocoma kahamanoa]|uniref:uncharacterized protein LOC113235352 n=1 Tax=Hyposmocoma kahamanoa TaxID=1477025 RepID=UPI000E6DA584|nr:uncharacterized protein LOC113235352 [Hyposmocoma kahamanoa]
MAAVWSASAAPFYTTVCNQEIGCETGFYCETDFTCKPCLRCQDLKRELPPTSMACVTSILECGPCVDGLKEDPNMAQCIMSIEQGLPTWAIIGIVTGSLLLFILICAIAAHILRNLLYLKIFACKYK